MSLFSRNRKSSHLNAFAGPSGGELRPSLDTLAAIEELSLAVRNNPDAVETYLALGNLFRSRGEIERAVHIRNTLIVRAEIDDSLKGRAWYELGRDYKRGGMLDRALNAFENARQTLKNEPAIILELAKLSARTQEYLKAADFYAQIENYKAQAHFLAQQACLEKKNPKNSQTKKLLYRALKVFPGSIEAWIEILSYDFDGQLWGKFQKNFAKAWPQIQPGLQFLLLEGLLNYAGKKQKSQTKNFLPEQCASVILTVLKQNEMDILSHYYGALILAGQNKIDDACTWLEKSLLLKSDFWPARLELLLHSIDTQELTPSFQTQLEFFLEKGRTMKKFVCSSCGLKRENIFFSCPRCESWYSISYRQSLTD